MLLPFYSLLLALGLVVSAPWWMLRMATTARYREGLMQRLGRVPAYLRDAQGKRTVWLHTVSVGELLAATRLVAELEAALGEGYRIVISTTTRTGQALARERFGAERVFYMPLDFAFAIRPYLKVLRPAALLLMESELWPRMLHECARRKIPVAVVNARISDRSFGRAMRVRFLWKHILRKPTLWLAQSEQDAARLVALGVSVEAVMTPGNLKYDIRAPKQSRAAELIREIADGRPIIVAGSTVGDNKSNEESWLITVWGGRAKNQYEAMLVLAPRHPERFQSAWEDAIEFPSIKMTDLFADKHVRPTCGTLRLEPPCKADIIILDTIGDLSAVYSVADVAFVGGSLLKRCGHNPLEAAQFGVPVVMGPSFENFHDVIGKMQAAKGIKITHGEAEGTKEPRIGPAQLAMRDSLETMIVELLQNPIEARALGEHGRAVYESQSGATGRTVTALIGMIGAAR